MKTAIYQYWDGGINEAIKSSVSNIKAYAKRIGADHTFEHNPKWIVNKLGLNLGSYTAHYGAFKPVYESEWDDYDKILFLDSDIFAVDELRDNIFDSFHGEVGICDEPFQPKQRTITTGRITSAQDEKFAGFMKSTYGVELPRNEDGLVREFNSGVVLYSSHGRLRAQTEFDKFSDYAKKVRNYGLIDFYGSDQGFIRAMISAKKIKVQEMDSGWNSYIHGTRDKIQPKRRILDWRDENTKFVHCQFPGADKMDEQQLWKIVNLPREEWGYNI
jgi:hypothetical protein